MKTGMDEINLIELAQNYNDPETAREFLESVRWPNGPVCPHCKSTKAYRLTANVQSKSGGRAGLCKCADCRQQFTVTVGTIFEQSKIPLNKWLMGIFLLCSSKKGMSAHQLHRMLKITYKTAWFMAHRIRFAMDKGPLADLLNGTVEIDETYVGGKPRPINNDTSPKKKGRRTGEDKKTPVAALVQRDGAVKTQVMTDVNAKNLAQFINRNIGPDAVVNTDNFALYARHFKSKANRHEMVNHSAKEYARTESDGTVSHVNTAESFFALIKRGVYGTFHHVSKVHLHRYCHEFEFRWDNRKLSDGQRLEVALEMTEGKRLTYRQTV